MQLSSKATLWLSMFVALTAGCATTPPSPQWNPVSQVAEAEYLPYEKAGTGAVVGQAYLAKKIDGVVTAAGSTVTLDPATSVGVEWWEKAGKLWMYRSLAPPSPGFAKARRTALADNAGKFKFSELPSGKYYVRTEITWRIGNYNSIQGGLVGQLVEVRDGESTEVTLNQKLP